MVGSYEIYLCEAADEVLCTSS